MKPQRLLTSELAGVEYSGRSGVTHDCVRAIARLIYSGELIKKACLITCQQFHAFVLFGQFDDIFVVKNGFASGYGGEGHKGLSTVLQLFDRHHIEVDEYEVDQKLMDRLECSALLKRDIEWIEGARSVHPRRLVDYQFLTEAELKHSAAYLSICFPPALPYGLIDNRIMDLAVAFHEDEDRAIVAAYRRLEDTIRSRTEIFDSGAKLFSRAFLSDGAPLTWEVEDVNEAKGRANMFTAIFGAFRNARMHREQKQGRDEALREFLLVNELFLLESHAVPRNQGEQTDA